MTVTAVEIFSQTEMSGDAEVSLTSTTTGTGSSIAVDGTEARGSVAGLSLPVAAGDELQLWTEDPAGISHYRVKVWFTRT